MRGKNVTINGKADENLAQENTFFLCVNNSIIFDSPFGCI